MRDDFEGILFTNLVDFDMLYGHRNDIAGYANALKEFDRRIPEILANLREDDLLVITADHGCDPSTESTIIQENMCLYLYTERSLKAM